MGIAAIAFIGLGFLIVFLGAMSLRNTHQNPQYQNHPDDPYVADTKYRRVHVWIILAGAGPLIIGVLLILLITM